MTGPELSAEDLAAAGYVATVHAAAYEQLAARFSDWVTVDVGEVVGSHVQVQLELTDAARAGLSELVDQLMAEDPSVVDLGGGWVVQADVETRAAAERRQTVEIVCARCGHGYTRHWPADRSCTQGMRDHADCACPGFAWVDPQGPAETYGGGQ